MMFTDFGLYIGIKVLWLKVLEIGLGHLGFKVQGFWVWGCRV